MHKRSSNVLPWNISRSCLCSAAPWSLSACEDIWTALKCCLSTILVQTPETLKQLELVMRLMSKLTVFKGIKEKHNIYLSTCEWHHQQTVRTEAFREKSLLCCHWLDWNTMQRDGGLTPSCECRALIISRYYHPGSTLEQRLQTSHIMTPPLSCREDMPWSLVIRADLIEHFLICLHF